MKIAIIGSDNAGGALGRLWAKVGHYVIFGVRNPPQGRGNSNPPMQGIGAGTAVMSLLDAAMKADIIVLTAPWPTVPETIKALGDLSGKVLIDCTNPLALNGEGSLSLSLGSTTSGAEEIEKLAAGSMVVLLLWLYYSAQIFLFGAEFTRIYAEHHGAQVKPAENALPVTVAERAEQGMPLPAQ